MTHPLAAASLAGRYLAGHAGPRRRGAGRSREPGGPRRDGERRRDLVRWRAGCAYSSGFLPTALGEWPGRCRGELNGFARRQASGSQSEVDRSDELPAESELILKRLGLVLGLLIGIPASANDLPHGLWLVEDGEGAIEFARCDDALCGRLVWLRDADASRPPLDVNNPDPAQRLRPLCGLPLLTGFRQDPDGVWRGGDIYNPDDGRRYSASIRRDGPDRLFLRGYFLVPLLGSTQTWTRVVGDLPRCDG